MTSVWEKTLNAQRKKYLEHQVHSEKCLLKKLASVNALSFDTILPKDIMVTIFDYVGQENKKLAKDIALSSSTRPNLSIKENCALYMKQMSCNSGSFRQFLELFRNHHTDDQSAMLNMPVSQVIKLFHVPKKMERAIREALTGIKQKPSRKSNKRTEKASHWMPKDPFSPKRRASPISEPLPEKSKLQRFNEAIAQHQKNSRKNIKQMRQMTGKDKFDCPSEIPNIFNPYE